MGVLDQLSDTQRKALLYGAPIVGAIVIGSRLHSSSSSGTPAAPVAPSPVGAVGSTDAIGTGQLAEFQSSITDALSSLSQRQTDLEKSGSPSSTPTPATPSYTSGAKTFVEGLYRDILGRTPSLSEENYWVGRLLSGEAQQHVAQAFSAAAQVELNRRGA